MNPIKTVMLLAFLFAATAYAGPELHELASENKGKSIAVVSVSANNWANSLQGWNKANTDELMGSRLNVMLEYAETLFAKDWKVIKADTFVSKAEYQILAGEQRDVGLPVIGGATMPLFSRDRKQLIKARLDKEIATKLATAVGADYLIVVYSEWAIATGKFVPTSKSLAKNVVSIYDVNGKQVYKGRKDTTGDKTLGGMGRVAVDETTIDQWVLAFQEGITILFDHGRE